MGKNIIKFFGLILYAQKQNEAKTIYLISISRNIWMVRPTMQRFKRSKLWPTMKPFVLGPYQNQKQTQLE